jgi:hypothetical protein
VTPTVAVTAPAGAGAPGNAAVASPSGARVSRVGAVDDAQAIILADGNAYLFAADVASLPKSGGEATNLTRNSAMRFAGTIASGGHPRLAQSGGRIFLTNSDEIQQPSTPQAVVYWIADPTVATISTRGEAPSFLKVGNVEVRGVAADAAWVYWLQGGEVSRVTPEHLPMDRLMKMPLAGGTPSVVTAKLGNAVDLAVDATSVYVATVVADKKGAIVRVPIAGGAPTAMTVDETWPDEQTTLALDATHLYWTAGDRLVRLSKTAPARSAPADVVKGFDALTIGEARTYAIDDTHVYWTSKTAVMRARKDGSAPPERLIEGKRLGVIAVDATDVFFVSADAMYDFSLKKLSKK